MINSDEQDATLSTVWPALVDVIIATLMILLLFMIMQHITFFLSDALKRIDITTRQNKLIEMIHSRERSGELPADIISIDARGDHQILRFSSTMLFPVGKAVIPTENTSSFQFIDALGALLKEAYYQEKLFDQIYIEGHTDTTPINSMLFPSNWELSAARALYVARYFIDGNIIKPVISTKRFIGISGYGKYNNIESNDTESGKAANRRIEILLVYSERS